MSKHNAQNERIKRDYFRLLKEARGYDEASIDAVAQSIARFESYTRYRGFDRFHIEQAIGFRRWLEEQTNLRTGRPLSKATMSSTMRALREFFLWLGGQPGFRSRISFGDTAYFSLSKKDNRAALSAVEKPVPTLDQIEAVLKAMPTETVLQRRDRAVVAFTIITGARDNAIASLRVGHVDVEQRLLFQDPRTVRTKASKAISTWFFPVRGSAEQIVLDWIVELKTTHGWSETDPLFPATEVGQGNDHQFVALGMKRSTWRNSDPIRKIFRTAFACAGLPYSNPHSFRKTLTLLGERICRTQEQFKAWSQNLGHEKVQTTLSSYGTVAPHRQAEIMQALREQPKVGQEDLASLLARAGLRLSAI